ncbi:MAG TPA: Rpn family recombination-promoting nuclease/putative transposase [Gammaproteobacteria bacterium]|nr:Rpn family recombination-promoting nuclease/putative transposase [Gammaproteobacteria bacterium]
MSKYLDPKTDIVFKKIFGQHPHLLKSFLNAVLPLPEDGLIDSLEYLSNEQAPVIPAFKYTVVDVRCTDQKGRVFIVEMQIQWTTSFKQRMLFNASKAYVNQLEKGEHYHLLKPVYGLGLINTIFEPDTNDWYHHYKIVNVKSPRTEIKDLQLIFIELPKFKTQNLREKKLQVLWLRFMSELNEKVNQVPLEWLEAPEIQEAVALAEETAYSPAELAAYDRYWDAISIEKTLVGDAYKSGQDQGIALGFERGLEQGLEQGREQGWEEGQREIKYAMARRLLAKGLSAEEVASLSELPLQVIETLKLSVE